MCGRKLQNFPNSSLLVSASSKHLSTAPHDPANHSWAIKHIHTMLFDQFHLDYGLMFKWMTAHMQIYISYLYSRLQRGLLIIGKYEGQHGDWRKHQCSLVCSLQIFEPHGFPPHIFPHTPAANTENPSQCFLDCTLNLEFNTRRKCFLN